MVGRVWAGFGITEVGTGSEALVTGITEPVFVVITLVTSTLLVMVGARDASNTMEEDMGTLSWLVKTGCPVGLRDSSQEQLLTKSKQKSGQIWNSKMPK